MRARSSQVYLRACMSMPACLRACWGWARLCAFLRAGGVRADLCARASERIGVCGPPFLYSLSLELSLSTGPRLRPNCMNSLNFGLRHYVLFKVAFIIMVISTNVIIMIYRESLVQAIAIISQPESPPPPPSMSLLALSVGASSTSTPTDPVHQRPWYYVTRRA